jgi:hypothetical protein
MAICQGHLMNGVFFGGKFFAYWKKERKIKIREMERK